MICAKKKHIPLVGSIHILPENVLAPFFSSDYGEVYLVLSCVLLQSC
jgi:hypothetical protein